MSLPGRYRPPITPPDSGPSRKIFADRSGSAPLSAIHITAGNCAAVDPFCDGKLPQRGFMRQKQVELPAFLANRFGSAYPQSRQAQSIGCVRTWNGACALFIDAARLPKLRASVARQTRSKTAAMPCPPPMHIVTSA